MEDYAYNYSLDAGYIKAADYPKQKVSMSKLFNFIAASSTGSILAGAIVTPDKIGSKEPKYYASDVVDFYYN